MWCPLFGQVFCRIIDESNREIGKLRKQVDEGVCIPKFGSKADEICNSVSAHPSPLHLWRRLSPRYVYL